MTNPETTTPSTPKPARRVRVAAYALIQDGDSVLICRLRAPLPNGEYLWSLPGGGLDFGEQPLDGLIREVAEETSLEIEAGALLDVYSGIWQRENGDIHAIGLIYRAKVVGGTLTNEVDGSSDQCQWFPIARLSEITLNHSAQLGLKYLENSDQN